MTSRPSAKVTCFVRSDVVLIKEHMHDPLGKKSPSFVHVGPESAKVMITSNDMTYLGISTVAIAIVTDGNAKRRPMVDGETSPNTAKKCSERTWRKTLGERGEEATYWIHEPEG